ncbi:hypothetical protein [Microvirga terricola]|uniref:ABC transporter permease n=1 Tax=Microvirga terricola TaxID=2719797 RepID=A0ABX0VE14_9HYPH|nr:hypothetical protein [Microvirga terricola]NIX77726.1 hypothetical protein [Microvirga terricola]
MTTDLHQGPLEASFAKTKPSGRERRRARRRRRVWFEEILAWVLVPAILVGCYWMVELTLNALGTSTGAVVNGLSTIRSAL